MSSSFTLKVSHGSELRRVTFPSPATFSSVSQAIIQLFPATLAPNSFFLRWVDDDGDLITIAADEDVREAIEYSKRAGRDVLKVVVVIIADKDKQAEDKPSGMDTTEPQQHSQSQPQPQPHQHRPVRQELPDFDKDGRPHHHGVTCDGCNRPLYGIRYKCTECDDFDLCEECEAKEEHPNEHVTLKIRVPTKVELWNPYGGRLHGGGRHRHHHGGHHAHHHGGPWGHAAGPWGFGAGWGHHGGPHGGPWERRGWGNWGNWWDRDVPSHQPQQQPQQQPGAGPFGGPFGGFGGPWGGRCGRFRFHQPPAAENSVPVPTSSSSSSASAAGAQTPSYTQPPSEPQTPQPTQSESSPFFTAAPRTPEAEEAYATHLQILQDMGFFDRETNLRLLRERNGRLEDVVSKLTQLSFD